MNKLLQYLSLSKKETFQTDFSRFFHSASSAERKKVFLRVAKKATKDQQKMMNM
jgi:hypothetical protein